eukprot:TRINITY_DN5931_c0_g1_i6.p1 TRINITY_DN5931_c0_g1~~TRINITY_DN5931_c0_g1_i6.p1  ORF type:complete len:327 (-),score=28.57 TRINITY_DN5931_c0_g1_i6:1008-1988(-)
MIRIGSTERQKTDMKAICQGVTLTSLVKDLHEIFTPLVASARLRGGLNIADDFFSVIQHTKKTRKSKQKVKVDIIVNKTATFNQQIGGHKTSLAAFLVRLNDQMEIRGLTMSNLNINSICSSGGSKFMLNGLYGTSLQSVFESTRSQSLVDQRLLDLVFSSKADTFSHIPTKGDAIRSLVEGILFSDQIAKDFAFVLHRTFLDYFEIYQTRFDSRRRKKILSLSRYKAENLSSISSKIVFQTELKLTEALLKVIKADKRYLKYPVEYFEYNVAKEGEKLVDKFLSDLPKMQASNNQIRLKVSWFRLVVYSNPCLGKDIRKRSYFLA